MDINKHLENTFNIIKNEPLFMVLGGLMVLIMNLASIGLLAGPIFGGYLLAIIWYFREQRKPVFSDLFNGFQRIGALFPFIFSTLLVIIGFFFLIIPGILLWTWWIYVLILMADKEMSLAKAMATSRRKVQEKGFFMHLVFIVMVSLLPSFIINAGAFFLPPLKMLHILVMPIQCAGLSSLYLEQFATFHQDSPPSGGNSIPPTPPPNSEY